jgi:hypothetical protein
MVKEVIKFNNQELIKTVEYDSFFLGMRIDGIAYFYLKNNVEITVELQNEFIILYNNLSDVMNYPIVYEFGENCNITKEARENGILIEGLSPISATAIIASNSIYQLIGNFYIKFNKPKKPYKVFRKMEDAINWLTPFVEIK